MATVVAIVDTKYSRVHTRTHTQHTFILFIYREFSSRREGENSIGYLGGEMEEGEEGEGELRFSFPRDRKAKSVLSTVQGQDSGNLQL